MASRTISRSVSMSWLWASRLKVELRFASMVFLCFMWGVSLRGFDLRLARRIQTTLCDPVGRHGVGEAARSLFEGDRDDGGVDGLIVGQLIEPAEQFRARGRFTNVGTVQGPPLQARNAGNCFGQPFSGPPIFRI